MNRRSRNTSPGAAAFAQAGGNQTWIARALGVHQSHISRTLSGEYAITDEFRIALRAHVDPDDADRIIALIGQQ